MGAITVFVFKSAICLAVFYLFYKLLLSKETFHRFNRFALLSILCFSAIVPLIKVVTEKPVAQTMINIEDFILMNAQIITETDSSWHLSWSAMAVGIYLLGFIIFLLYNIISLCSMLKLVRHCHIAERNSNYTLVIYKGEITPFSWMHYIVISEQDMTENGESIITHELGHIKCGHSWDLLLTNIVVLIQWFNPAAWLLRQEIQNIHEFEADDYVLNKGIDAKKYQLLLIKKAVGARLFTMANNLNHSSLKKRITMMLQRKSNPWARAKYFFILPLAALTVVAFARPEITNIEDEISSVKPQDFQSLIPQTTDLSSTPQTLDASPVNELSDEEISKMVEEANKFDPSTLEGLKVKEGGDAAEAMASMFPGLLNDNDDNDEAFNVCEVMPTYPGGMSALMEFLSTNIKYPKEAFEKCIQGRVFITYIVDKEGNIKNAKVIKSLCPECDAEALRVINAMPKWTPGQQNGKNVNVKYTLPITFRLQDKSTSETVTEITNDANKKGNNTDVRVLKSGKTEEMEINMLRDGDQINVSKGKLRIRSTSETDLSKVKIILDGKQITKEEMEKISPEQISSIEVLKDEDARQKYNATDGAIIITSKK